MALPTARLRGEGCFDLYPAFSADGKWLACAGWFATPVAVWETATGRRRHTFTPDVGPVMAFSPSGDLLATAGAEAVRVWDLGSGASGARFPCDEAPAEEELGPIPEYRKVYFDATGRQLFLLTREWIRVLDLGVHQEVFVYRFGPEDRGLDLAESKGRWIALTAHRRGGVGMSPSGRWLFSGIDFPSGRRRFVTPVSGHVRLTPDRQWALFSTDIDKRKDEEPYEVWNTGEGCRCGGVTLPRDRPVALEVFSADGRHVAYTSFSDNEVLVWDTRTGGIANRIPLTGFYHPVCFSPTHRLLAVVMNRPEEGMDQTVFYDPLTGDALGCAHHRLMSSRAHHRVSPCGRWFTSVTSINADTEVQCPDPYGTVYLTDLNPLLPLARRW